MKPYEVWFHDFHEGVPSRCSIAHPDMACMRPNNFNHTPFVRTVKIYCLGFNSISST